MRKVRLAALGLVLLCTPSAALAQTALPSLGDGPVSARAIQLVLMLTVLSLAPGILMTVTSFTRIVVALSLLRSGLKVQTIDTDKTAFTRSYQPGNPAADATGYVLTPNVNTLVEAADMKAAQRSYEANLNAIEAAKGLTMRTIDLLK